MSGFEIAGIVLGAIPLFISTIQNYAEVYDKISIASEVGLYLSKSRAYIKKHVQFRKEYGRLASFLVMFVVPEVLPLMEKIEKEVLQGDTQRAISFMEAQTSSLNMIALAGAIIAQVAITALSLDRLNDSHWTSEAFFIMSLVCGILSVFFACVMHPSTRGLFNADRIRDWLSKPTKAAHLAQLNLELKRAEIKILLSRRSKFTTERARVARDPRDMYLRDLEVLLSLHRWEVASCYAAIMLIVPSRLLTVSLSYFVVGLGVYIGKMYTANLIPEYGTGSLGILVIFVGTMLAALIAFYIPNAMKSDETSVHERFEELVRLVHLEVGGTSEGIDLEMQDVTQLDPDINIESSQSNIRGEDDDAASITAKMPMTDILPKGDTEEIQIAPPPSSSSSTPAIPARSSYYEPKSSGSKPNQSSRAGGIDFEAVLKDLLKAQEESASASRRLLELYQSERKHPDSD